MLAASKLLKGSAANKASHSAEGQPTQAEEEILFRCFSMVDSDEDGKLSVADITKVMQLMGIDAISIELIHLQYDDLIRSKGGFTFGVFKEFVHDLASKFSSLDGGKYYVLLSLEEAEHFRGVLHARQHLPLLHSEAATPAGEDKRITTAALWFMGDLEMSVLATSQG